MLLGVLALRWRLAGCRVGQSRSNLRQGCRLNPGLKRRGCCLVRTVGNLVSLSAILRLLQSRTQTNIVSTPNLITLDNETVQAQLS